MEIADHDVRSDDALSIEPEHDAQHAMRAGVLWPHVDDQLVGVEHRTGFGRHNSLQSSVFGLRSSVFGLTQYPTSLAWLSASTNPAGFPSGARRDPRADSPCAAETPAT